MLRALALAACLTSPARAQMPAPVADAAFIGRLSVLRGATLDGVRRFAARREEDPAYRAVSERLRGSGVPDEFVRGAFASPDLRVHPEIVDRFNRPAESLPWERYRAIFITPQRIERGASFYRQNEALILAVAADYGVDPFVFLAIAGVESNFGNHRGAYTVFNALYTAIRAVPRRGGWATGELAAWLRLCWEDRVAPHSVRGSYAGAFGYGQFIPSSWRAYAVDRDGDGAREAYDWPDALASISNYLVRHGYRPGETDFSRAGSAWSAVYAYNHSDSYVRVVLELREEIKRKLASEPAG